MFNAVQDLTTRCKLRAEAIVAEVGTRVAKSSGCPWLGKVLRFVVAEWWL
jgi:hypothetical protein